eukprot:CAMPEP_0196667120 /NCGR_PEP_ID=MMETSP1086-20130531/64902_1 /TAXON_ID=77921 /ORGANISM="Cyanoptyche  gloeocystis , Strain SAG4.97" /LENGTH=62 /DNA_ID=CAMNT_0042004409 /DNA_START=1399 /DNA_END=1587 /DNA_ORIENTATION=-
MEIIGGLNDWLIMTINVPVSCESWAPVARPVELYLSDMEDPEGGLRVLVRMWDDFSILVQHI